MIIGFHGCDENTCHKLLTNPDHIEISKKKYDWLGNGMYFWENNYERALQWAKDKQKRNAEQKHGSKIKPAVIGAVLQLNYCCDFLDSKYIKTLKQYHELMRAVYENGDMTLPENKDVGFDKHKDKILRELDCAVIEFMHGEIRSRSRKQFETQAYTDIRNFDSVRGVFTEGGPAFDGAGIFEKMPYSGLY